jgi:hypothetical protein
VAQRKEHEIQREGKDKGAPKTSKGRTLRKRLRTHQGGKGIKDLGGRRPIYLRKERTTADSIVE